MKTLGWTGEKLNCNVEEVLMGFRATVGLRTFV
jgi:hypothetical protein